MELTAEDTAIFVSRLYAGRSLTAIEEPTAVVIRAGHILAILPRNELPPSTTQARIWDFPNSTLLPGLIDCHVHFFLPGDGTPFPQAAALPDETLWERALRNASAALRAGITTARDCGAPRKMGFALRAAIAAQPNIGPRLLTCGRPITPPQGHTWYFGGEAGGRKAVERTARRLLTEGADFLKVINSGGGTPGTHPELPSYSREELLALANVAHAAEKKVAVHCIATAAVADALAVGADTIEHAYFMQPDGSMAIDPQVLAALARSRCWVIPTLAVGRSDSGVGKPDEAVARSQYIIDRKRSQFKVLHHAGVRIAAGSDAGWRTTPATGLLDEVAALVEGGMGPLEALQAATSHAAEALGLADRLGTVAPGYVADLLVVTGDPLRDVTALHSPRWVMKDGEVVWEGI